MAAATVSGATVTLQAKQKKRKIGKNEKFPLLQYSTFGGFPHTREREREREEAHADPHFCFGEAKIIAPFRGPPF